jgi:ADP-ribose pyrophosphatase
MQLVAARELREETGAEACDWRFLGTMEACIGVTTDTQWVYLATNLKKLSSRPDPDERIETRWVSFQDAVDAVLTGEIIEGASVAAILKMHVLRTSGLLE